VAQDLSRQDERRGTRRLLLGTAIIAIALFIGVIGWVFLPGNGVPNPGTQSRAAAEGGGTAAPSR
jgi:hypothetical protein